jgi:hypothetical protein
MMTTDRVQGYVVPIYIAYIKTVSHQDPLRHPRQEIAVMRYDRTPTGTGLCTHL